jgi:hypothetical protein
VVLCCFILKERDSFFHRRQQLSSMGGGNRGGRGRWRGAMCGGDVGRRGGDVVASADRGTNRLSTKTNEQQIHHVHERNGRNVNKNCLPPTKSKRSFRLLSYSSRKSLCWWMSQFDKPEESGSSNVVKGREKEWMTLRWNQYLLPR